MKRQIISVVLKLGGEALLLTIFVGIMNIIIGNWKQWDTSAKYSNAFFIAGCLLIVGGAFARQAAGQEWGTFQKLSAESSGGMSLVNGRSILSKQAALYG